MGSVESLGNLFAHKVIVDSGCGLASRGVVEVLRDGELRPYSQALIWCTYLPEPPTEEDDENYDTSAATLQLLAHCPKAKIWSLNIVVEEHVPGPLTPGDVEHTLDIVLDDFFHGLIC